MEDGYEVNDGVPTDEYRCECDSLGGWHCKQRRVHDSRFCNMHQNVYQLRNERLRRGRARSRKYLLLNEGQLVEVISKDVSLVDAWFTAKIIQLLPDRKNKIKVLIQYCSLLSGVDPLTEVVNSSLLRPPPPLLENKFFQLHQVVDAFCENGWWKGEIVETLENNTYSVYYSVWEEKKIFAADDLRIHQDWIGGKWVIPQTMDGDVRNTDILKDPARTRTESCTSSSSMETNFTEGIDVYVFLQKNKLRHHPTDMFRMPSRIVSDHQMTNCIQEQSTCAPSFNISGTPQTLVYCSVLDEAHGELSNSQIQQPQTSSDFRSPPQSTESFYGNEINQQKGVIAKQTNAILETKSPSKETVIDSSAIDLQSVTPCREVALAHHNQVTCQSETEIIPRETLMELPPQGEGGFDHNTSQDRIDIFTKTLVVYQRSHRTTNSSPGISTSILDSDRHVDPTKYVESSMSDGEQGDDVSLEDGTLLFTKTLSLWKTLQTMEVFQSVPQKPHFRTLVELNENLREGRAISFMLSFVAVVEKTRMLQFNEPRSSIIETLLVLNDLEAVGFHIQPIRARLEKLLSIQTVLLELDVEMNQVEEEIIKENIEENPLESEIDEITENLRNFQKSSAEMMKKQEMLLMKKHANDSDVAVLQKSIEEAEKEIQEINLQFSSVVASLG